MTTGTFGIASASYWWGRVAGGTTRLIYYLVTGDGWYLVYADDHLFLARGAGFVRQLVRAVAVLLVLPPAAHRLSQSGGRGRRGLDRLRDRPA